MTIRPPDHVTPRMQNISPQLKFYRRRAMQNAAAGLTVNGTARKRRANANNRRTEITMRRERGFEAWQLRVNRLRALGLTTRGATRIYSIYRGDALVLQKQIDDLAASLSASFHDLPSPAQARAMALEHSLAAVRKQLL